MLIYSEMDVSYNSNSKIVDHDCTTDCGGDCDCSGPTVDGDCWEGEGCYIPNHK